MIRIIIENLVDDQDHYTIISAALVIGEDGFTLSRLNYGEEAGLISYAEPENLGREGIRSFISQWKTRAKSIGLRLEVDAAISELLEGLTHDKDL